MSEQIRDLGFKPTISDNDVYRKPNIDRLGNAYYEYMVIYLDDCICISHQPKQYMDKLAKIYRLRGYHKLFNLHPISNVL